MQQGKSGTPIVYYVFDLLEVDGEPIVDLPLEERRKRLEKLLDKRNKTVRFSESFDDGRGTARRRERSRGSKGSWPSASARGTSPAGARATG